MSETNFILQEVIDELVNVNSSLLGPLMKLNYLGKLIKNEELISFSTKEIKGYNLEEELPDYRQTRSRLQAHVRNRFIDQNIEIPISLLEEPFKNALEFMRIYDGISIVESMISKMDNEKEKNSEFFRPIPFEMLRPIQDATDKLFAERMKLYVQSAQCIGNAHIFLEASSSIRERLLDLCMSIGEQFGFNIKITSFKNNSENNKIINNIMNNIINTTGDGNVVNTGNDNNITNSNTIHKGDIERLKKNFTEQGIDDADIAEIIEIVQDEQLNSNELGDKSKGWIMKIMEKSMNGIGKIATSASGNLLATLIKGYYGII